MSSTLATQVRALLERVAARPDGPAVLRDYDHLLQFTVLDGESFYVDIKGGSATVHAGTATPRPLAEAHEFKANQAVFEAFFSGRVRMSDAIQGGHLYPVAAHTTKRHIDHWLAKLVRLGLGQLSLREIY